MNEYLPWVQELIERHPNTLNDPEGLLTPLEATYRRAEEILQAIKKQNPKIPLDELTALAAGLHDIGRPLRKDQLFHELRGAMLIEQEAEKRGLTSSQEESSRLAQIILPHGTVYEFWTDPELREKRREFDAIQSIQLRPIT